MVSARVVVVGGGINGLVCANVLARAGVAVTLLERRDRVGGACVSASVDIDGKSCTYAAGATVLGLMQDFLFRETGLSERLRIWAPQQKKLVYFGDEREPTPVEPNARFRRDEERVVRYLQQGYRDARPPSLTEARDVLGEDVASRWIEGSATELLAHYLANERERVYAAMTVTESGPVSLRSPFSAFTIPLMDSGSVFGGKYGFVEGGIWRIPEELARLNLELGVRIETSARVDEIPPADRVVFATDPVTAANLIGRPELTSGLKLTGTAGKLTILFREPVRWKDTPVDADAAFRFLFFHETIDGLERAALQTEKDFAPGYIQIYCDGAGQRRLGNEEPFDRLVCFFKNVRFGKPGASLGPVRSFVESAVLRRIENPEALAWSELLSPFDMKERFFFPEGNIDHTMLCDGQTFAARSFSASPERFYQFGADERFYHCGSGAYPCGSVTGTAGFMCARELLRGLS
jgi:phytoene dehydrogenase-like protein